MAVVAVSKAPAGNLGGALAAVLSECGSRLALDGRTVLIKPNLVEPLPCSSGQTTNPVLVEALIVWCRRQGAARVAIGEGPSYFQPRSALRECFERTGMTAVARRQSVEWILFDEGPQREFRNHCPATPPRFLLSEHAFAWDRIINVPVPKPHYLTTISSAMKNLKGFIRREDKPGFHFCDARNGIHGAVTALNKIIRPCCNVVDCTAATHRSAGFLLAGTDIVAIDAVVASLMGHDPDTIGTVRLGHAAGLGEKELARIDIVGDDLQGVHMDCEQPAAYLARVFLGLRLHASQACSGCLIPIFAALRRMEAAGTCVRGPVAIVCGQSAGRFPPAGAVWVGRCAAESAGSGPYLPGCPPTKAAVLDFLCRTCAGSGSGEQGGGGTV